jgi:hypothetical protein
MKYYTFTQAIIFAVIEAQGTETPSFNDANYFALSAEEKQNQIWTQMLVDPTPNPYYSNAVMNA